MIHWMTALLLLGGVVGFTGCSSVPELESPIVCEGNFHYHLQDVCVNDKGGSCSGLLLTHWLKPIPGEI